MPNPQTTAPKPSLAGRVLLAEDDAAMRTLLTCRLRRAGFDSSTVFPRARILAGVGHKPKPQWTA